VTLHIENLPPKTLVGVNAEEGLTNSDEDGKVENGVWGQLPELNPIEEKKGAEKLVGRKRETTEQESNEHNSEALRRTWARNDTWKTNVIVRWGDEAEGSQLVHIAIGNGGGAPVAADFGRVRGAGALLLAHGVRSF
jgi:hypothetical protein